MSSLFSVDGKIAVVTGGTSGIGNMIAKALLEHGAKTYIIGRDQNQCDAAAHALNADGRCIGVAADLSSNTGIEYLRNKLTAREQHIDILVNNAGSMYDAPLADFSEQGWDEVVDLNLKSVFFLSQQLLPLLQAGASAEQHTSIINIGSVGGIRVGPKENYSYQAAKAGLHHLSGSLAKNLGGSHVTVNAIAPGFFPSRMTQIPEAAMAQVLAAVPRGRVGEADDMAGAVIYLASRAGSFVTGAVIPVAGGMTL